MPLRASPTLPHSATTRVARVAHPITTRNNLPQAEERMLAANENKEYLAIGEPPFVL